MLCNIFFEYDTTSLNLRWKPVAHTDRHVLASDISPIIEKQATQVAKERVSPEFSSSQLFIPAAKRKKFTIPLVHPRIVGWCYIPLFPTLWPRSQAGYLDIIYTDPDKPRLHTYVKEERLFFEVKLNGRQRNSLLSPFKHRRLRSLGLVLVLIYQLFAARLSTSRKWARSIKCGRKVCLQFAMEASLLRFKW